MVTMRAVRARWVQSLSLFVLAAVCVAGWVALSGISRGEDAPGGSGFILAPLGVAAIAAQSAASVRTRRNEVALAQLRGAHGLRLMWTTVAEPVAVLVVGVAVGAAAGWVVGRAVAQPGDAADSATWVWGTAAVMLAVSVSVVVLVSWRTFREPLAAKLSPVDRGAVSPPEAVFARLLVVLGAVASVYQARQLGEWRATWVSYASAGLVGLAAGQLAGWVLTVTSDTARRTRWPNRRLGWFLALRRLTRRHNSIGLVRLVVAAVVLAGLAATAGSAAAAWREQTARVETGGPKVFDVPSGALPAYQASQAADPEGRWLMAMVASPSASGGSYRDVFVDTARWRRVVGSYYADTPVAEVTRRLDVFPPPPPVPTAHGTTFSVSFPATSIDRAWPRSEDRRRLRADVLYGYAPLRFTVEYVDANGDNHALQVPARSWERPSRTGPGTVGWTAAAPGCARGCVPRSVLAQGYTRAPLRIQSMALGDLSLVPGVAGGPTPTTDRAALGVTEAGRGLVVRLATPYDARPLLDHARALQPALATSAPQLHRSRGATIVYGIDGDELPVRVAATVGALPLLGSEGVLLDLATAFRGAGPQVPQAVAKVVARADTPPAVLRALRATGALRGTSAYSPSRSDFHGSRHTLGTGVYWLCAAFALVIAAAGLTSSTVEQRTGRRREAASVRVVGVDTADLRRSYRYEAGVLGAGVAAVSAVATWVACEALLGVLPLVSPGEFGLSLDAAPPLGPVVGFAVAAGVWVTVAVLLSTAQLVRQSPPSTLRAEDR